MIRTSVICPICCGTTRINSVDLAGSLGKIARCPHCVNGQIWTDPFDDKKPFKVIVAQEKES